MSSTEETRASSAALTCSPGVWESSGSPGPKFAAGTPRSAKKATSVQPTLARGGTPEAATRAASTGSPSDGGAPAAASTSSQWSPGSRWGASSSRTVDSAWATVRSGANRWFTTTVARSGTTLPATPPSTETTWSCSAYSHPSMTGRRPSYPSIAVRTPASRWMAFRPAWGRAVWARSPVRVTRRRIVPWQPASTTPSVGSPRTATSASRRSGRTSHRRRSPLCSRATSSPA